MVGTILKLVLSMEMKRLRTEKKREGARRRYLFMVGTIPILVLSV